MSARSHLIAVAIVAGAAVAAPVPPAGPRAEGDAWSVALESSGECRAGKPASARVRLAAKGGYHVNLEYPTVFRPGDSSGVDFGSDRIPLAEGSTRTPCADQPGQACELASPLPFVVRSAGRVRVAGTLAFSVCNPERCLIEKVPLALALTAK